MIRRERLAVCATLPLARTLSRFDAGFTVPVWRDARLDFDEAAFDTLTPVELTVTRIMLTPCPDRSRHSLLPRGSIRRPSKTPALLEIRRLDFEFEDSGEQQLKRTFCNPL